MKFLLDQNVDRRFSMYLRDRKHNVTIIAVDYPAGLSDSKVLAIGHRESRIIITNDTDFGELAVRRQLPHSGIILFRVKVPSFTERCARLETVLANYHDRLDQFLVVTQRNVRVRPIPTSD